MVVAFFAAYLQLRRNLHPARDRRRRGRQRDPAGGRAGRHPRRQDLLRDPLPGLAAALRALRAWSGTAASCSPPWRSSGPCAAAGSRRGSPPTPSLRRCRSATPSGASAASWSATTTAGPPICRGASSSRSGCRAPTSPICAISSGSTSRPRCRATSWWRCTRRSSTRPALALAIWIVSLRLLARSKRPGTTALAVLGLLALERFAIEFLRAKDDRFLGGFTVAQAVSLTVMVDRRVAVGSRRARGRGAGARAAGARSAR